ncbi:MAG: TetR/AcrR family transcriptional regulator [Chloroflexota bacterium]
MTDNRSQLLTVATHLFATHGYDAVGVQQIVEAAGVTKPTLYYYFESKQGLLAAIILEHAELLLAIVQNAAAYDHDITRSITELVTAYFNYAQQNPVFYRMMLAMWFSPPSSEPHLNIADLQHQQFLIIESLFKQAATDHGNMRNRHAQYAATLKGLIDTYIALYLQGLVVNDNPELVYRLTHQFMHGIFS